MTGARFRTLLEALPRDAWQRVADGAAVVMVDDQALDIGPAGAANAIIGRGDGNDVQDADTLRAASLADAGGLLVNYYLTHPLSAAGFNAQAQQLLAHHGAQAFAAPAGDLPARSLFVDGGEVLALGSGDPRHRYGAYCELDSGLSPQQVGDRVQRWIRRGAAHERYLGMNLCRYNC